ncbi:hypothetical protein Ciccas_000114 [Cichlidogyrus casuarinus]|uniref:Uncharacterized protein n=1 Tax=Cichlidogyrus casuarinus TaxID=1844966 RepID=A0ABD2QNT5_9PLAT
MNSNDNSFVYILAPLALGLVLTGCSVACCCWRRYKKRKYVEDIREKYIITKVGELEGPGWSEVRKKNKFFKRKEKPRFTGFYGDDIPFDPSMQHRFEEDEKQSHYSLPQYGQYQNDGPQMGGSIISDHNDYYGRTNGHHQPSHEGSLVDEYINQNHPRYPAKRNNRDYSKRYQASDGGFSGSDLGSQSRNPLMSSPPLYLNEQRHDGSMISNASYGRQQHYPNYPTRQGY